MKTLWQCQGTFNCSESFVVGIVSLYLFVVMCLGYRHLLQDVNNIVDQNDRIIFLVATSSCTPSLLTILKQDSSSSAAPSPTP